MTYYDAYKLVATENELLDKMRRDIKVACVWGNNPDRLKAIEDAGNRVAKERGWIYGDTDYEANKRTV